MHFRDNSLFIIKQALLCLGECSKTALPGAICDTVSCISGSGQVLSIKNNVCKTFGSTSVRQVSKIICKNIFIKYELFKLMK